MSLKLLFREQKGQWLNLMDEMLPETLLPYADLNLKAAAEKLRSKNL